MRQPIGDGLSKRDVRKSSAGNVTIRYFLKVYIVCKMFHRGQQQGNSLMKQYIPDTFKHS